MSDLGYSLVPVDHDPFVDQLPPSQGVATTQTTVQPDEIAKLAGQGTYLTVDNQKPKVTYDEAKANLYGLTGIPDIQKGAEEFGKGNYLAGIGQAGYGALNAGALALPAARLAGGALKEALPAIPGVLSNEYGTFAGIGAETANFSKLTRAQQLQAAGVPREEILRQTGWSQSLADNQWKFEIPDKEVHFKKTMPYPSNRPPGMYMEPFGRSTVFVEKDEGSPLQDILHAPQLFRAYPWLQDIKVIPHDELASGGTLYDPIKNEIHLSADANKGSISNLLHEIQHAVQVKEGFGYGSNTKMAGSLENYLKTSGEVESRLTQYRQNLTGTERRNLPWWPAEDLPSDPQAAEDQVRQIHSGALAAAQKTFPISERVPRYTADVPEHQQIFSQELPSPEGGMETFLGTKARLANERVLDLAKSLEEKGMRNEQIRKDTGWFRGIDDQWRFEHSDLSAKLTLDKYRQARGSGEAKLSDLLDHPTLYKNYPNPFGELPALGDTPVRAIRAPLRGGFDAAYDEANNELLIPENTFARLNDKPEELKNLLLHEVTHIIQKREGFAVGGSSKNFLPSDIFQRQNAADLARYALFKYADEHNIPPKEAWATFEKTLSGETKLDSLDPEFSDKLKAARDPAIYVRNAYDDAYENYRKLAGETEARLTEQRSTLGPQAIKDISPFPVNSPPINKLYSYDVPPAEQVARYGSPENANQLQASEKPKNILGPVAAGGYTWPGGKPIIGYHGTPYTFEPTEKNPLGEFDLSKFGTGEGGGLFGYGINQATDRSVANWYKKFLESRGDVGHIYQSQMFLKPEDALGYHKSEQSPYVQKILSGMPEVDGPVQTGGQIYQNLVDKLGSTKAASERLLEAGIPGIRAGGNIISPRNGIMYYDPDNKRPNYVIFSPQLINIVKKYGIGALISSGFPLGSYAIPVDYQPDFGSLH